MTGVAGSKAPLRRSRWGLHVSTVLLLLAICGVPLRFTGAATWLLQLWLPLGLVLGILAPVWAACGFLAATVYLMLSMMRPYNVVQHLLEMVTGVALILLMVPVF